MKKINKYLLAILTITSLSLSACNNQAKEAPKEETKIEEKSETPETTSVKITIYDKVNDKEILTEDAEIGKDGLEKYLEEKHQAKFENGMMIELAGISQDKDKNQYWMYYVNDQMAEVGIGDYEVKEGDKIEFRFEQM